MSNDIPKNPDVTYFGKTNYRGQEKVFGIKRRDRRQHMYVLGKSGTGKSALLKNMIVQNIANGEGLAVVDPHGELVEEILELIPPERKDDVIYFNPADTESHIGFNVLEVPDPKYKHLIAAGLMSVFTKIWANAWSARMEYIMNNAILALIDTPGSTLLGIPRLLVDQDYRQRIIANITDPVVRGFWINEYEAWQDKFRNEAIAPIQNKVGQFLSTSIIRNIVGQSKSTMNIFDIMNNKKILLVNVSKGRIGEDNSALLGAMIITKIQLAAMERVRIPEDERKDFYLYVDEFQNFVTDSFAGILSEARKYRLCLVVAHQYIAQLSTAESNAVRDAVFGNVGTMIIFRVGAADAEFLEPEFDPEFTAQDFVNLPNYHIYLRLLVDGMTSRPFSSKTIPPYRSEGSEHIAREIIEASRTLYAKPKETVEAEIQRWSSSRPGDEEEEKNVTDRIEDAKPDKDGLYKVRCSFTDCKNIATVPFKPEKGRPVYCKEHIEKLKSGELKPLPSKRPGADKKSSKSMSALASIGIAFSADKINKDEPDTDAKPNRFKNNKDVKKDRTPREQRPIETRKVRIAQPERNEPKGADTTGLQSILKGIFGNANAKGADATKETKPQSSPPTETAKTEVTTEKPETPTMSLKDLGKKDSKDVETSTIPKPSNDRSAKDESKNALMQALERANSGQTAAAAYQKDIDDAEQKEPRRSAAEEEKETEKRLEDLRLKMEREQAEIKRQLEDERRKREAAEQETKTHAEKLVEEEKKRRELESQSREAQSRIAAIEAEKTAIESELSDKGENTAVLEAAKTKLESEHAKLMQEKDRILNEHAAVLERAKKMEDERERIALEHKEAARKAQELAREKEERERREAEIKARKELPEDVLKSVLEDL